MVDKKIEDHLTANARISKKDIMLGNFIGGLMWGLGSVIGATVIVGLLLTVLRNTHIVPGLEDIIRPPQIQQNQNNSK